MSIRRSLLGLTGAAVLAVAACSGASSSGSPTLTLPSIAIPSAALPSIALEGFCADFASKVETAWPNIDASTAAALAPLMRQWAEKPETSSVKADVTTIVTWITLAATATSVTSPPPDVMTAFDRIKTFATANC